MSADGVGRRGEFLDGLYQQREAIDPVQAFTVEDTVDGVVDRPVSGFVNHADTVG